MPSLVECLTGVLLLCTTGMNIAQTALQTNSFIGERPNLLRSGKDGSGRLSRTLRLFSSSLMPEPEGVRVYIAFHPSTASESFH